MIMRATPRRLQRLEDGDGRQPRGAVAGVRIAVGLLMLCWLAIYILRLPAARDGRLMAVNESAILKSELRWAVVVGGIVAIILGAILFAALSMHINPPSNREYRRPEDAAPVGRVHRGESGHARRPGRRASSRG